MRAATGRVPANRTGESSDAIIDRFLRLHPKLIDLSLERLRRLLERLHHPERRLPPIVHVAGTNGKGSTIAFCRAILEGAGLAVHVYTSPHLVRFHERIRLGRLEGGALVDEDRLADALLRCEAANAGEPITLFEITTAAAFLLFAEVPADALLLEVGLGGRFDATNVIDVPAVSVVTAIGLDHAEHLGDTVEAIAGEKAGIFRRGAPAVIAPQDYAQAEDVLVRAAERAGARPILVGNADFHVAAERGRLVYQDERGLLDLPLPRLAGRHQYGNAGAAIAAVRAAFGELESSAFEAGMERVSWPGRLQQLTRGRLVDLLPDGAELWIDGGHNADGGRVLAAAIGDLEERSPAPLVLVSAMLKTKDSQAFLESFRGLARDIVTVRLRQSELGRAPDELAAMAEAAGLRASTAPSLEAALTRLRDTAWERPPRVLVCGTLYLMGEVLEANGTPPV